MKHRLGFVITSLGYGGAERVVVNLANYFSSGAYDVSVLILNDYAPLACLLSPKIKVVNLRKNRIITGALACALELRKQKINIALVSLFPLTGLIYVFTKIIFYRLTYLPIEHNNPSAIPVQSSKPYSSLLWLFAHIAYKNCSVVTVSRSLSKSVSEYYRLPEGRAVTIYNPIMQDSFEEKTFLFEREIRRLSTKSNMIRRKFLSIGSLTPQKNQVLALEAVMKLITRGYLVHLTIVGDGQLRDDLKRYAEQNNICDYVTFSDGTTDIEKFYEETDVFLLTSNYEGFGNVLVEALSHGLPIISTDCDFGPREILEEGVHGILVPCGDVQLLVDAMAGDKFPGTAISRARRSMDFSVRVSAKKYEKLFKLTVE